MRVRQVLALLFLLCGFQSIKTFGQVVATWTDTNGNYSNAANWSTLSVPNNGGGTTYAVLINGTGADTVTFDASGTTINSLTIGTGETFQDNGLAPILKIGDPASPVAGSLSNGGAINWSNGSLLAVDITAGNGSLTNSGTINLSNSTLTLNDGGNKTAATLSGGGVLKLTGGTITGIAGDESFVNADNIIQGSGTISNLSFTNNGTINANGPAPLTIRPGSGGFLNNLSGEINVAGVGDLVIDATAGSFMNRGMIDVNGSQFRVSGDIPLGLSLGGTLRLENGSTGTISGSVGGYGSQVYVDKSNLTVGGDWVGGYSVNLSLTNRSTAIVQGNFANQYSSVLSLSGGSVAVVRGDFGVGEYAQTTVDGSSLAVLGNYSNEAFASTNIQNSSVFIVGGNFVQGGAPTLLSISGGSIATVLGDLSNGLASTVVVDGSALSVSGTFHNSGGNVLLTPTATLVAGNYSQSDGSTDVAGRLVTGSYLQSGGATTIESGGLVKAATFTATGGTVTVNGMLDPTGIDIGSGASLQGTGTIIGNVAMGGTITPGAPGTPGTLTIFGNYEQTESGDLEELIGPLSRSFLLVNGDVALDSGSFLDITLLNGYNPLGQTFSIMDYYSLVGQFSNGSSFSEDGYIWDITYGQHEIDVTAVRTPEPSSLLLLFIGLAALAVYAHRKMGLSRHFA